MTNFLTALQLVVTM